MITNPSSGRKAFREWVDRHPDPGWGMMPLTHITKGIGAEDIIGAGQITPTPCKVFGSPLAYFFYGRPAYRISGDGAVKVEATCPFCFVFDAALIRDAASIYAFDTGAFSNRMYTRIVPDEMKLDDFSLEKDERRVNRLISSVFPTMIAYYDADTTQAISPEEGAEPWEFHARAYLDLIKSPGRNEPDDRICSVEVVFGNPVPLEATLRAVVVPHTLWHKKRAPWLETLFEGGVDILPYVFVPGRHPEYYHAQLESAIKEKYREWKVLPS